MLGYNISINNNSDNNRFSNKINIQKVSKNTLYKKRIEVNNNNYLDNNCNKDMKLQDYNYNKEINLNEINKNKLEDKLLNSLKIGKVKKSNEKGNPKSRFKSAKLYDIKIDDINTNNNNSINQRNIETDSNKNNNDYKINFSNTINNKNSSKKKENKKFTEYNELTQNKIVKKAFPKINKIKLKKLRVDNNNKFNENMVNKRTNKFITNQNIINISENKTERKRSKKNDNKEEKLEKYKDNKSIDKNKLKQLNMSYQNNNNINLRNKIIKKQNSKKILTKIIKNKYEKDIFYKSFNSNCFNNINNLNHKKNTESDLYQNKIKNKNIINQSKYLNNTSILPKKNNTFYKSFNNETNYCETINYTNHTIYSNLNKKKYSIIKKMNKKYNNKYIPNPKIKIKINNKQKVFHNNNINTECIFSRLGKKKELSNRKNNIREIRPVSFSNNNRLNALFKSDYNENNCYSNNNSENKNKINGHNRRNIENFNLNKRKAFKHIINLKKFLEKCNQRKIHNKFYSLNFDLKSKRKINISDVVK